MGIAASPAAQAAMNERHAQEVSRICGPLHAEPQPRVVFYRLSHRFVDSEKNVSEEAGRIIYYALAVGHNTGLCDCLKEELSCSEEQYKRIVSRVEDEAAHYKLEGIIRSDEIVVDRSHLAVLDEPVHLLAQALAAEAQACEPAAQADAQGTSVQVFAQEADWAAVREDAAWFAHFAQMLDAIKEEPEVYYMGRLRR